MKPKPFIEFITRFFRLTGVLITGLVGFLVGLIIDIWIPDLDSIISYLTIFVISFVFASYLTFRDLYLDYFSLFQEKIKAEQSKPIVEFGFINNKNDICKELNISLGKNPPKPNIDELIDKKRQELLINSTESYGPVYLFLNDNYLHEIEPYLDRYRNFLENRYECEIDKAFLIHFSTHNPGVIPATDINIEIKMPKQYHIPDRHQRFDRRTISDDEITYYLHEPKEPSPTIDSLFHLPNYSIPYFDNHNDIVLEQSNIQVPYFDEIEGNIYITYKIKKMVQHTNYNKLDPIWIWLGDIDHSEVWQLETKITCSEIPNEINTILLIDIKYDENNPENKIA